MQTPRRGPGMLDSRTKRSLGLPQRAESLAGEQGGDVHSTPASMMAAGAVQQAWSRESSEPRVGEHWVEPEGQRGAQAEERHPPAGCWVACILSHESGFKFLILLLQPAKVLGLQASPPCPASPKVL